ncbi:eL22 family ribosomal protein, partial [Salmonella sp. s54836]|uniref:eL22 family ribosomal protein n=1 Tax=Salmonella sp. s54836 TaxID=3159673 RepID=UPI00397FC08C
MATKKGRIVKTSKVKSKKISLRFCVDCTTAVEDQLIVTGNLVDFLKQRIKVNNKTGNLGDHIHVNKAEGKIIVTSNIPMSKRYLKYLTKKFLKKHNLRDF